MNNKTKEKGNSALVELISLRSEEYTDFKEVIKFNKYKNLANSIPYVMEFDISNKVSEFVHNNIYNASMTFSANLDNIILQNIFKSNNIKHIDASDIWESNIKTIKHDIVNALDGINIKENILPIVYYPAFLLPLFTDYQEKDQDIMQLEDTQLIFINPIPITSLNDEPFSIVFTDNEPSISVDYSMFILNKEEIKASTIVGFTNKCAIFDDLDFFQESETLTGVYSIVKDINADNFLVFKVNITLDESKIIVIDNITTDTNMFK